MYKPKILVVEDDPADHQSDAHYPGYTGISVPYSPNRVRALCWSAVSYNPDVIILDLGLPDMDGVDIIRKSPRMEPACRSSSSAPGVRISDKVEALDAGADDYLTKPFSIDELLARLRAALRRSRADYGTAQQNTAVYHNGSLTIDYAAGCVYLDGEEIST